MSTEDLHTYFHSATVSIKALNGVTLSVDPGESVGVVGATGSGKSILARSIMGLVRYPGHIAGGSIRYGKTELVGIPEADLRRLRARDFGYIVSNPRSRLNPVLNVGTQLAKVIHAKQPGISGRTSRERALELLGTVALADPNRTARMLPSELSGGMCQRIIIAMAISASPRLLIADEPTAGLDVTVQRQILDLIHGLVAETGAALLLMTRDLGIIAHYTDRVVVLEKGSIVDESAVEGFYSHPSHPHSKYLLESALLASHGGGAQS